MNYRIIINSISLIVYSLIIVNSIFINSRFINSIMELINYIIIME